MTKCIVPKGELEGPLMKGVGDGASSFRMSNIAGDSVRDDSHLPRFYLLGCFSNLIIVCYCLCMLTFLLQ